MLISIEPLRVKEKICFSRQRTILFETFAVFERLSRESEIRGEGETEKIGKPAPASEQNWAAMRFSLK
jgi:hypothetical protein